MYIFNPLKLFTQFLQPKTQDFEKKKKVLLSPTLQWVIGQKHMQSLRDLPKVTQGEFRSQTWP